MVIGFTRTVRLSRHPTVGVALCDLRVSERLSSSRVAFPVTVIFLVQWFSELAHRNVESDCANECLRSHVLGEILSSSCDELRLLRCTPTEG